jgi:hypothetical protein
MPRLSQNVCRVGAASIMKSNLGLSGAHSAVRRAILQRNPSRRSRASQFQS